MSKQRSIGYRLQRAHSHNDVFIVACDWSTEWAREQKRLIGQLEYAVSHNDYDKLCIVTGRIKSSAVSRFKVLYKIFSKMYEILDNEKKINE